jgi:N-acetylglucosaminyldiphosphoundecaprenol N-acetyl-beta-D-mannosaminyltransferase
LFVGMGTPRQEAFIRDHWERLGVRIAVGVGGSFEVMAGLRLRAPSWLQYVGLEWLVRLLQEPGRLLPRYLKANSRFCLLIARATASRLKRQMNSS